MAACRRWGTFRVSWIVFTSETFRAKFTNGRWPYQVLYAIIDQLDALRESNPMSAIDFGVELPYSGPEGGVMYCLRPLVVGTPQRTYKIRILVQLDSRPERVWAMDFADVAQQGL
jgi:hypothetical protein